jgi:hypothetical protein
MESGNVASRLGFSCPERMGEVKENRMGTAPSDRARMRNDLRELAKLAAPAATDSSATPHAFETADSSGYVDLSAFSATDDDWVDRELARAGGRAKGGAVLTPGSMAPVAMSSLIDTSQAEMTMGSRKRGRAYTALALAGVAIVAVLAVTLARHAPGSTKNAPAAGSAAAAAAVAAPPPAPEAAQPATAATPPVASASAAPIAVTVSSPDPSPGSKKHAASRAHTAPPAAATHAAATPRPAAAIPAAVPASRSGGGGGDSLMDLMKASINSPKKVH